MKLLKSSVLCFTKILCLVSIFCFVSCIVSISLEMTFILFLHFSIIILLKKVNKKNISTKGPNPLPHVPFSIPLYPLVQSHDFDGISSILPLDRQLHLIPPYSPLTRISFCFPLHHPLASSLMKPRLRLAHL